MSLNIQINTKALQSSLQKLQTAGNKKQVLAIVGATAQQVVLERFHNSKQYFTPNAPSTIKQKKGNNPLRDTGTLMNSITHTVASNTVAVGTNIQYADKVHDGRKYEGIPPRPFLKPDKNMNKEINNALQTHLKEVFA